MNNEELIVFLKRTIELIEESDSPMMKRRYVGILEGALIASGIKTAGTMFEFKDIEVENPNIFAPWFPGTSKTITRKEYYAELMVRWAEEYIEACKDVPQ